MTKSIKLNLFLELMQFMEISILLETLYFLTTLDYLALIIQKISTMLVIGQQTALTSMDSITLLLLRLQ